MCADCAHKTSLQSVWVAAEYAGLTEKLLHQYKFERLRAAHKPLAAALDSLLPHLDPEVTIVPLPTAQGRVRQRGYDQSVLIAAELAKARSLKLLRAIERNLSTRQTGADRKTRIKQAEGACTLPQPNMVKGKVVWLVDDICTTGASLDAAARLLKKAGAKEVHACVIAWQRLAARL
jgi:ComF family protein